MPGVDRPQASRLEGMVHFRLKTIGGLDPHPADDKLMLQLIIVFGMFPQTPLNVLVEPSEATQ